MCQTWLLLRCVVSGSGACGRQQLVQKVLPSDEPCSPASWLVWVLRSLHCSARAYWVYGKLLGSGGKSRCFLLVCQNCLNPVSHTGLLKQEEVIFAVVEAQQFKMKMPTRWFLLGDLFPALLVVPADGCVTSASPHHFPWVCVYAQTFSFTRIPVTLDFSLLNDPTLSLSLPVFTFFSFGGQQYFSITN